MATRSRPCAGMEFDGSETQMIPACQGKEGISILQLDIRSSADGVVLFGLEGDLLESWRLSSQDHSLLWQMNLAKVVKLHARVHLLPSSASTSLICAWMHCLQEIQAQLDLPAPILLNAMAITDDRIFIAGGGPGMAAVAALRLSANAVNPRVEAMHNLSVPAVWSPNQLGIAGKQSTVLLTGHDQCAVLVDMATGQTKKHMQSAAATAAAPTHDGWVLVVGNDFVALPDKTTTHAAPPAANLNSIYETLSAACQGQLGASTLAQQLLR